MKELKCVDDFFVAYEYPNINWMDENPANFPVGESLWMSREFDLTADNVDMSNAPDPEFIVQYSNNSIDVMEMKNTSDGSLPMPDYDYLKFGVWYKPTDAEAMSAYSTYYIREESLPGYSLTFKGEALFSDEL